MATSIIKNVTPQINGVQLYGNKTSSNLGIGTGTYMQHWTDSLSLPDNTVKNYKEITFNAGTWLVELLVDWPGNTSNGMRCAFFGTGSADWSTVCGGGSNYCSPANASGYETTNSFMVISVSANTKHYLKLFQSSGQTMTINDVRVTAIKL